VGATYLDIEDMGTKITKIREKIKKPGTKITKIRDQKVTKI
jgi:hypothetical protein